MAVATVRGGGCAACSQAHSQLDRCSCPGSAQAMLCLGRLPFTIQAQLGEAD